jgi:hypothetical protein
MSTFRLALAFTTVFTLAACGTGATNGGSNPNSGDNGGGNNGGNNGGGNGNGNSGSSAFYLPYQATSSGNGETGLLVIPSDNLSASPIFVTRTPASSQTVSTVGNSSQPNLNSATNVVTSVSPYALLYIAVGSDGHQHLYRLKLADTTVAPTAVQVSSLSLPTTTALCPGPAAVSSTQTNIYDPTSLFVLLHTNSAGSSSCGKGGDVYQVVHYADSSTTAPTVISITPHALSMLLPLYRSGGALGGMVLLDSTGNLDFYGDDTFTNPTVLTSGVTQYFDLVDDKGVDNTGGTGASTAFLSVVTANGTAIWRVPATGTASNIYTPAGILGLTAVADNNNVYFTDTTNPTPLSMNGTRTIYQEAISGGSPVAIYSATVTGLAPAAEDRLLASNGTTLMLASGGGGIGTQTTSIFSLPIGSGGTLTTIAGPFSGQVAVSVCPASFGDVTSDEILLNVLDTSAGSTSTSGYSSEVLTPNGQVKQTLDNSAFLIMPAPIPCGLESGTVLQVRGITDTNGSGYGGGTVSSFNLTSFTATPLTTTSGNGNYVVPKADQLLTAFLSDSVGFGIVGPTATPPSPGGALPGTPSSGVGFDVVKGLIVNVSVPNSNVSAIF